ncbi:MULTISPECIES: fluoride efflux transporter FluC [Virgibacillus]|uniref:Fluoride-specific ion channel FluC n=2 Tax=Virgibacillus TaxID=84406 RepID=A0A024Q9H6_9BACI|nr:MULTISPECIES: CrcB family protein [Virgibacillus]EQB37363.1 hypothetical protein M948_02140 [Virgibacillus sp. CM-4]MYL40116.1 chromosome condensation protein CrcB [Virgibacillus massiliensis]GGJ61468.1 putative fluoride ion transporter CrcB 2 [Virgibacillus kapii]CDQ39139.1 camphor resistance protein CrcB [Virgibacillus massiliensis]
MNWLLIAVGGIIGSITRYQLSLLANKRLIGTWTANITGSALLGVLLHYYLDGVLPRAGWLLLGVGFCGAYTTFSTFGNESLRLILKKEFKLAMVYISTSVLFSLFAVLLILYLL